eukprot:395657-Pleurochrysis_carterae.AAC.5
MVSSSKSRTILSCTPIVTVRRLQLLSTMRRSAVKGGGDSDRRTYFVDAGTTGTGKMSRVDGRAQPNACLFACCHMHIAKQAQHALYKHSKCLQIRQHPSENAKHDYLCHQGELQAVPVDNTNARLLK